MEEAEIGDATEIENQTENEVGGEDGACCAPSCCPPMTRTVLDDRQATALASRLKALADPVRIRLVSLLACCDGGELCACDLPELLGRKQPTVSHHLKVLTEAGLIVREQRGKWAWFQLADDGLEEVRTALGCPPPDRDAAPEAGTTY